MGLYLGLELITDRDSLAPATMETAALCDRLLELGVIVQPTGDHLNVLKIKPPLCISRESAEFSCKPWKSRSSRLRRSWVWPLTIRVIWRPI